MEFQLNSVIYCHRIVCAYVSFPGCVRFLSFFVWPVPCVGQKRPSVAPGACGDDFIKVQVYYAPTTRPTCNLFLCAAGANKLARLLCTRRFMRRPRRAKHVPRSLCPSALDLAQPYRSFCPERV